MPVHCSPGSVPFESGTLGASCGSEQDVLTLIKGSTNRFACSAESRMNCAKRQPAWYRCSACLLYLWLGTSTILSRVPQISRFTDRSSSMSTSAVACRRRHSWDVDVTRLVLTRVVGETQVTKRCCDTGTQGVIFPDVPVAPVVSG